MHHCPQSRKDAFHCFSTITTIVLLSLTFPIVPLAMTIQPLTAQAQTPDARKAEADRLLQQGRDQANASQFVAALQSWQKALTIYREIKDRLGEAKTLTNMGFVYDSLGDYFKAIEYYQQSLKIAQEIKDRKLEGTIRNNLGSTYYSLGNYTKAIEYQQQGLAIARVISSRQSIGAGGRNPIDIKPTGNPIQKQNFQKLHQLLIEPIAPLLPTNPDERVIFIPHESLFLVPFAALQDKDGKYLIEKHTILTSPAIQVLELTHQQRQKVKGKDVLVMGNPTMPSVGIPPQKLPPLPNAEKEAVAIATLENTTALIGSNATLAAFKQKLPTARIIHLATHGLLEGENKGIPTAIALAPSGNDNGLLTPAEIVDLPINAELVVLSACDTGRGKITGDGVIGLSRSLITAGASSVIVSLWSVPDSPTSELMTEFYQKLQPNSDKAKALRSAMLNTMKRHPNPIDWAAFTLIGETQ